MALTVFSTRNGNNLLTRLNPVSKLVCLILLSSSSVHAGPIQLASFFAFILALSAIIRMPLLGYLEQTPSLPILTAFIFFTELAVSRSIGGSLFEAAGFFFLIILGMIMMDTTAPDELAASTGVLLSKVFGKRAWSFASDVMLTLSMIPRIFSTSRVMLQARRARSGSFLAHPVGNLSAYTISLLSMLMDDLRNYDLALRCRLYDPSAPRAAKGYRMADLCAIIISLVAFLWTRLF